MKYRFTTQAPAPATTTRRRTPRAARSTRSPPRARISSRSGSTRRAAATRAVARVGHGDGRSGAQAQPDHHGAHRRARRRQHGDRRRACTCSCTTCATRRSGNDFIARLKDRNITVISTLAREEGMFVFGSDGRGFTDNPFFTKSVPPERMAVLTGKMRDAQAKMPGRDRAIARLRDRQDERQEDGPMPACASVSAPTPAAHPTASSCRASSSTGRWN